MRLEVFDSGRLLPFAGLHDMALSPQPGRLDFLLICSPPAYHQITRAVCFQRANIADKDCLAASFKVKYGITRR